MFDLDTSPRVFGVPVGSDFGRAFLDGLMARLTGSPPEALARVRIYVNTKRTAIRLHEMLLQDGARLLPDIRLITDLANDPAAPLALPPRQPPLRRTLDLSRLVAGFLDTRAIPTPRSSVFDLAESLGSLLDEFHSAGVPLDKLAQIDVGDHSAHWEQSRSFLMILAEYLGAQALADDAARMHAAASAFARHWSDQPPDHPVIVAGSTGSRGATAQFMQAVAQLPQGAVVLPGLDPHLTASVWQRLTDDPRTADHAQAGLARFCGSLGLTPDQVSEWAAGNTLNKHRNKLISLALNPAPVTYAWLDAGPAMTPHLATALERVSLIEAATRKEEATAIALCLREAVAEGRQSALITPDRDLARRVAAELSRWSILPDDSGGEPLHLTPPGIFARLVAEAFGKELTPKSLISILKHPITDSSASTRAAHLAFTRRLEVEVLRGGMPAVSFAALAQHVSGWNDPAAKGWIEWARTVLQPLEVQSEMPLQNWEYLHRQTLEKLAAGPSGAGQTELWCKDAGASLRQVFDDMKTEAAGGVLRAPDYRALLQTVLQTQSEREPAMTHPLVSIWGTLEARVQGADLVILGSLNEGTWPRMPVADPWMNRAMRDQIGLPLPERRIGLSAHDFQQACGAAEIVWSRSLRDDDAPSVASRWIIRLTNLLDGLGDPGRDALLRITDRGARLLALARQVDQPDTAVPSAVRPSPRVPVHARPRQLSVTRIAPLINDPYQVYARDVLRLRPLDPLTPEADVRLRGTVFHEILERFSQPDVDLSEAALLRIAETTLAARVGPPETRQLWLGRIAALAEWLVAKEVERRQICPVSWREVPGTRELPGLDFTLTAKADRIGQAQDGSLVVYDYKTGAAPIPVEIRRYEKQLPLEAAILEHGGFGGVPAGAVSAMEYISLADGGEIKSVPMTADGGDPQIAATWDGFETLIATLRADGFGFTARDRPANIKYPSDYDHLSRFGEWQDTDPPEPEDMP